MHVLFVSIAIEDPVHGTALYALLSSILTCPIFAHEFPRWDNNKKSLAKPFLKKLLLMKFLIKSLEPSATLGLPLLVTTGLS